MKPVARTDRLIKQVVDQETLVYDPDDDTACCLNSFATLVWRQCDGAHSVEQIAALVSAEMQFPDGVTAEDAVWRVLDELEEHRLISMPADGDVEEATSGIRRRELVKALAMLPLFPAILQITAPSRSQTTSPSPSATASAPRSTASQTPTHTPTNSQTAMPPTPTPSASHP